ncbi:MAG: J domain-containing protein [Flavobacteriales bacterium]|nr:J domain-containing protein [Flavobacteriales bacterium]
MVQYYHVLGLKSNASDDEIKRAYRSLAKKYHPDVSQEPDARKRFIEINKAYLILKDPENRKALHQKHRHVNHQRRAAAYEEYFRRQEQWAAQRARNIANDDYAKFTRSPIYKTAMVLNNAYNYIFLVVGLCVCFGPILAWRRFVVNNPFQDYSYSRFIAPMVIGILFTLAIYYFLFLNKTNFDEE